MDPLIEAWSATLVDGTVIHSKDAGSFERVHEQGGCHRCEFSVAGRSYHVSCVAANGEKIKLFTRRAIVDILTPNAKQVNMPVAEITRADKSFCRIYIHPEHGVVFSSLDLNI